MSARSSFGLMTAAVPMSLLVGASGGYLLHTHQSNDRVAQLEQEIQQLKKEAAHPNIDRPSNEEATSAIEKTGRSFDISECKPRQAVPGVTCTGDRNHDFRIVRRNETTWNAVVRKSRWSLGTDTMNGGLG